jgi:hypothetical protein
VWLKRLNAIKDKEWIMGNMSYCRFENTLEDLRDCYEAMGDDIDDKREARCRLKLYDVCRDIVTDFERENLIVDEPVKREPIKSSGNLKEDCITYLKENRKIEAVKFYREQTGLGLKESLDAVNQIQNEIE